MAGQPFWARQRPEGVSVRKTRIHPSLSAIFQSDSARLPFSIQQCSKVPHEGFEPDPKVTSCIVIAQGVARCLCNTNFTPFFRVSHIVLKMCHDGLFLVLH